MKVFLSLCACVFLCLCVWWLRRWLRYQRLTRNVTSFPGALPLIGHAHVFTGIFRAILRSSQYGNANGGVLKLWRGPFIAFVVSDPTIALKLLNTCIQKDVTYKFTSSWIGQGLATADAPQWKRHRKLLNPTFSQHVLDTFLEVFNRRSARCVARLQATVGAGAFNQQPHLARCTLEVICETAIGLSSEDADTIVDDEFGLSMQRIMHGYDKRFRTFWMHIDWLYKLSGAWRREKAHAKILKAKTTTVLNKKKLAMVQARESKTVCNRFKPLLDLLLELGEDGSLTDQEISEEVDTIILVGSDTTSVATTYIMVFLRNYPEVQERVYREIKDVFGDSKRDVNKDDFPQLIYMDAVIKETLRLYPLGPVLARLAEQDVKLGHFTVPSGSNVWINVWGMHRHPMWGDPHAFRPERWLDPATLPEDPSAFAAFSLGRRGCIGRGYAMMLMKTLLVHMLRVYKISGTEQKLVNTVAVVLQPVSGHFVELSYR